MAAPELSVVILDIIEGARYREVDGDIVEISRLVIVHDIEHNFPFGISDKVLKLALDASGVPQFGAFHPTQSGLRLVKRDARARGHGIVDIELIYKRPGPQHPPELPFNIAVTGSVQQIQTMLDRDGVQITVKHPDDPDGKVQGGEITPFESLMEVTLERSETTSDPVAIVRSLMNRVNTGNFSLDNTNSPRTWLIADVTFELEQLGSDFGPPIYRASYTLRNNPDGFDPQVVYIDPETGRPPDLLIPDVGFKTIPWHFTHDFAVTFGG